MRHRRRRPSPRGLVWRRRPRASFLRCLSARRRARRTETMVSRACLTRKGPRSKREESLQKKHHVGFAASAAGVVPAAGHSALRQKLEGLPVLVQAMLSNDPNVQLEATTQFRMLSAQ